MNNQVTNKQELSHWEYDPYIVFNNPLANKLLRKNFDRMFIAIKKRCNNILVIGSGPGDHLPIISTYADEIIGLDINLNYVNMANKMLKERNILNARAVHEDAQNMPFRNETFDCVFGMNILHHVLGKKVYREIYRVLKKEGVYLGLEPNILNPLSAVKHTLQKGESGAFKVNRFNISRKFRQVKFSNIKLYPTNLTLKFLNRFTYLLLSAADNFSYFPFSLFSINFHIYARK